MRKEVILIMDYRSDEGVRPRKEMICPCITTNTREGGSYIPSSTPLIVERWTKSESKTTQN